MKKLTLSLMVGIAVTLSVAQAASADVVFGYPCYTYLQPLPSMGSAGGVQVHLWSGPACTGALVAAPSFCSSGAAVPFCDAAYPYREAQLVALWQMLQQAIFKQSYLVVFTKAGCTQCGQVVYFYE